jgi:hypothetical protein
VKSFTDLTGINFISSENKDILMTCYVILIVNMSWDSQGSNPGVCEILQTQLKGPGFHPITYRMATGSFQGEKRPQCGVKHTPSSNAEVKERLELYFFSPSVPS